VEADETRSRARTEPVEARPPAGDLELPAAVRNATGAWWLVLLIGVLCFITGFIVLAQPDVSIATLAVISGIFLLIEGIFDVFSALGRSAEHRGTPLVLGLVSAIAGVVLIRHPFDAVVVLALFVGLWLLIFGIVRLVSAFSLSERRGANILIALLEVLAGIVIVASPGIGVRTLAVLIGLAFILRGAAIAALGWLMRDVHRALRPGRPAA
jgi:uncharacterized membrane protein HdeD (DUF308 family)